MGGQAVDGRWADNKAVQGRMRLSHRSGRQLVQLQAAANPGSRAQQAHAHAALLPAQSWGRRPPLRSHHTPVGTWQASNAETNRHRGLIGRRAGGRQEPHGTATWQHRPELITPAAHLVPLVVGGVQVGSLKVLQGQSRRGRQGRQGGPNVGWQAAAACRPHPQPHSHDAWSASQASQASQAAWSCRPQRPPTCVSRG